MTSSQLMEKDARFTCSADVSGGDLGMSLNRLNLTLIINNHKEAQMRRAKKEVQNETEKEVKTMFEVDRIFKTNTDNNLKAFVDIKVANAVLIKGIRVLSNKEGGLFVSMPAQQAGDGKYYPTVRALAAETKQELQDVILAAYNS